MDKVLKYEIQSDVRDIQAEIDYEEYMFNKIFKADVTFRMAYEKFNLIYDIYGPDMYRKYVPSVYQRQDFVHLVNTQNYLILYDRHGKKKYKNLMYTVNLEYFRKYYGKVRVFLYKLTNIFSRKKIKAKAEEQLLLPESIPTIHT